MLVHILGGEMKNQARDMVLKVTIKREYKVTMRSVVDFDEAVKKVKMQILDGFVESEYVGANEDIHIIETSEPGTIGITLYDPSGEYVITNL